MIRRVAFVALACFALSHASAQGQRSTDEQRLAITLGELQPQRPGKVDAYVVIAALDSDPVFNREAREAGRVFARRFGAEGRTVVLAEDEGDDQASGAGTPANLTAALARAASLMDQSEDVLVLYTTSHGSPHEGLNYRSDLYGSGVIAPGQLASMLPASAHNRLIILQACFSGQFIPVLAAPQTVLATASSSMRSSFGCSASNDWTFFGHALINLAMRTPDPFVRQFRRAVVMIMGWEEKVGIDPSNPQINIGKETGHWLAALDAAAGRVPASPVGRPPPEIAN